MLITAVQVTLILGVSAHGTLSLLLHGQAMAGATVLNGALPLQQPASRLTTPRQQVPSSSSLLVNLLAVNGQLMALMVTLLMFNPFLATALRSLKAVWASTHQPALTPRPSLVPAATFTSTGNFYPPLISRLGTSPMNPNLKIPLK